MRLFFANCVGNLLVDRTVFEIDKDPGGRGNDRRKNLALTVQVLKSNPPAEKKILAKSFKRVEMTYPRWSLMLELQRPDQP